MKKLKIFTLVALLGLSCTGKSWADDSAGDSPTVTPTPLSDSQEIALLNQRIDSLQDHVNTKIDVLLQYYYEHQSNGSAGTGGIYAKPGTNEWDSFNFRRSDIILTTELQPQKIALIWNLDPSQKSFWNGPNYATLIKDLYVRFDEIPYVSIYAGQFKFAQGLEGRTFSGNLDFYDYSGIANYFGNKRDTGIQIAGSKIPAGAFQFEYQASLIGGTGQSTWDNNVDKDISGRIGITYDDNLYLGATGYSGWEPNGVRNDWSLEGRWVYEGFKVQGEFLEGQVDPADNSNANNSVWTSVPTGWNGETKPLGFYGQVSYRIADYRLGLRYDAYNPDTTTGSFYNSEQDTLTIGFDWFQDKDAFRLGLNYEDHFAAYQSIVSQVQVFI